MDDDRYRDAPDEGGDTAPAAPAVPAPRTDPVTPPGPPGPAVPAGAGAGGGTETRTDGGPGTDGGPAPDTAPPLPAALEAVLMIVQEPVDEVVLAQVLEHPVDEVAATLRRLSAEYTAQGRGFDLRRVAGGWRFYTRPEHAGAVERFILDGQQSKLTQAALETLAVVAYRQPVSRGRVSAVRGVNCDGVMRTLLARGLVEECGVEYETQATLYRTTPFFLERMGLASLDELPELAPFLPEVEALEAETEGAFGGLPLRRPSATAPPAAPNGDTGGESGAGEAGPVDGETTTEV